MRVRIIKLGMLPYEVAYHAAPSQDALMDFMRTHGNDVTPIPQGPASRGRTWFFKDTNNTAVWVRDASNLPVLAHEMYHAAMFIARAAGIDDEETVAYMIQYLMAVAVGDVA